jgi:hypothetical protein
MDRPRATSYLPSMSTEHGQLVGTLKRLQATANWCARKFTTGHLKVEYRVAFSTGAALPWRLVEMHRDVQHADEPRVLRRMHCFRSAESLERSVQERTVWKTRDQALVASHLVRVRTSIDKMPSAEPEAQGTRPSQALTADLMVLTATRKALRAQLCLTRPDRVIDLLNK